MPGSVDLGSVNTLVYCLGTPSLGYGKAADGGEHGNEVCGGQRLDRLARQGRWIGGLNRTEWQSEWSFDRPRPSLLKLLLGLLGLVHTAPYCANVSKSLQDVKQTSSTLREAHKDWRSHSHTHPESGARSVHYETGKLKSSGGIVSWRTR